MGSNVKAFLILAAVVIVLDLANAAMQTQPARVTTGVRLPMPGKRRTTRYDHVTQRRIVVNGKCYYSKSKAYLAPDESLAIPGCQQVTCLKQGTKYYMRTVSCGKVDKKCRVPGDRSLPYPECCPRNACLELD